MVSIICALIILFSFVLCGINAAEHQLGESCSATSQCTATNAVCSSGNSGKCQCPSTYYDTNGPETVGGSCTLKVGLGGTCPQATPDLANTATCSDTNARCTRSSDSSYTCQCISTYYDNMMNTDRKCVINVDCPGGWRSYRSSCYYYSNGWLDWDNAFERCKALQSYLVEIEDSAENAFLLSGRHPYYIGLSNRETEGTWKWVASGNTLVFSSWGWRQPDNVGGIENCVRFSGGEKGRWIDAPCSTTLRYICEKKILDVDCPDGWRIYRSSCYYFSTDKMNWDQALERCKALQSSLVEIEDSAENDFLTLFMYSVYSVYDSLIGLSNKGTEGTWKWMTSRNGLAFSAWSSGQPDNHGDNEKCVQFWGDTDHWNDVSCFTSFPYICEKNYCGELSITNANVSDSRTAYGTEVDISCYEGYHISGNTTVQCQADGLWSGSPTCNLIVERKLGESCSTTRQCSETNAVCSSGKSRKCQCPSTYYDTNGSDTVGGSCTLKVELGDNCLRTNACVTTNAGCVGGKCVCNSQYYDDNGVTTLGGNCLDITNLQVTNVDFPLSSIKTSEIGVAWSAPTDYKQYIDGYTVKWRLTYNSSINVKSQTVVSSVTSLTLTRGIQSGRAYTVTIISINDQTQQKSQRITSVTKEQASKPGVSGGLDWSNSDRDASSGTIKVAWYPAPAFVSQYIVELLDGTAVIASSTIQPPQRHSEFQSTGLRDGYRYSVTIVARSESYDSGKRVSGGTFTAEFKTMPQIPDPPQSGFCKDPTDKSITLAWSEPDDTKGDLVQYHIYVYQYTGIVKFTVSTAGTGAQMTIDILDSGTSYAFRIYTENEKYNSSRYDSVSAGCKTKAKMSESPTNLEITEVTSRSFDISWDKPSETHSAENYGYVLQIKDDHDICRNEIIYRCSDCDGGFMTSNLNGLCGSTVRTEVNKTKQELDGQLIHSASLVPDIAYIVIVTAYNDAGRGYPAKDTERTKEEAPQIPYNVTVDEMGTTSCNVSWNIDGPRPGQTNFTLMLMADSPAKSKEFIVTGFDIRSYLVQGLEEYWSYSLSVTATTSIGAKTSDRTQLKTRPTAPGKVSDFTITEAPRSIYTWMQISWKAPAILDQNSIIKEYSLDFSTSERNATTQSLSHELGENHEYTIVVNVIPGETYTFEVYARNSLDMKGDVTNVVKQAPAGVPVNIEDTLQVDVIPMNKVKDIEQRQFTVTLVQEFYEESTNGQIQASGLLACAKDCNSQGIETLSDFNAMANWKDASQKGFTLYRVTNPAWMDKAKAQYSRKQWNVTTIEYTIGSDDCSHAPPKQYCNGPLQPGTSYKLVAVSCTNGGCLLSRAYGPFVTAATERSTERSNFSTKSIVIGGVVLGFTILILLVYAGYTTVLLRRNKANKDGVGVNTPVRNDSRSHTYMNETFQAGVADVGGSLNFATGKESDTQYSTLDDNTGYDRTTYDIIQPSVRQY